MNIAEVIDQARKQYLERYGIEPTHVHVFPDVFGSTAGPFSGIGGQSVTTFQCCVVMELDEVGSALVFYNGRLKWAIPRVDGAFMESLMVGFMDDKKVYSLMKGDRQ